MTSSFMSNIGNGIGLLSFQQISTHLGNNNTRHQYMLVATQLQNSLAGKNLEILVSTKLNMSQECSPAEKVANSILNCIRQSIACRLRQEILALSTPVLLCPVRGSQYHGDMDQGVSHRCI